jgi:undecaprenyl-diphosphatase
LSKALDLHSAHRPLLSRVNTLYLSALSAILLIALYFAAVRGMHTTIVTLHGELSSFDAIITSHLNRLANRWRLLDTAMLFLVERNLLKGAPIVFLCWAAFFERQNGRDRTEGRSKLAAVIPLAIAGVVFARVLAKILPFRQRPFATPALHFHMPAGLDVSRLYSWSSFPSDHTVLFVALSIGVLFASRRLGWIALTYTAICIMLPRVYMGLHWSTDVLAGALLGVAFAFGADITAYRELVWRWVEKVWRDSPGILAGCVFLLSYEITVLFDTPISIMMALLKHKH